MLNPFAGLITGYRDAFFYGRFLAPAHWATLGVESFLILFAGYSFYKYLDRRVIKFL
jgi:ABC-type polysaccharide/polyol phosphate export permease